MSGKKSIEQTAEELLKPITDRLGLEIYDVEYVKEGNERYLRAYIDKEGGVNIQDCEDVSRAYSDVLDEADPIPEAYILEVSSPGLGRQLKKERHFAKSLGKEVEVRLYEDLDGRREYAGVLKAYSATDITLQLPDKEQVFDRSKLSVIRLKMDF
ncbi:MAG: ribosome maturation factor RimP [Lachnospiraceae bacterium]|nr:ribosome maturation factor RimP [Lachnospiraceae bacterium]